jgi:type IV secretory pathway TraG/TraD family ATPase VirD4
MISITGCALKWSRRVLGGGQEGAGTAGPLVTALTAATIEVAEEHAARSRGGRRATLLVAVLDEAANVCRWEDLPDLYSHCGSRGMPIMAVFQSWSQGVGVFGKEGMLKLWSAANVKLYAGGVAEDEFLRTLSELIGTYDKETTSASYNKGVRSTTSALRREKILEVADLTSMGRGRAIMLCSGARAALVDTVPWYNGSKEQVAAINASITAHDASSGPANTAPVSPVVTVMPPLEAQPTADLDTEQDASLRSER